MEVGSVFTSAGLARVYPNRNLPRDFHHVFSHLVGLSHLLEDFVFGIEFQSVCSHLNFLSSGPGQSPVCRIAMGTGWPVPE